MVRLINFLEYRLFGLIVVLTWTNLLGSLGHHIDAAVGFLEARLSVKVGLGC